MTTMMIKTILIKDARGTNKTPVVGIKERKSNNVQAVVALQNIQNKRLTGMHLRNSK